MIQAKNIRDLFTCILLLYCAGTVSAQRDLSLKAARKLTDKGYYFEAREKYEAALKQNPDDPEINAEYADILFFYLEDYEHAYRSIQKSIRNEKDSSVMVLYCLAKCEHYLEKYTEAEKHYKSILAKLGNHKADNDLRNEISVYLKNIEYAKNNNSNNNLARLRVVNAGKNVNTIYPEYVPVVDEKENFLMFTSKRKNKINKLPDEEDDKYREDMYMSVRKGDNFSPAEILPTGYFGTEELKNSKRNESLVSLSPDGKTLFLFKKGTLWKSNFANGKWNVPELLEKKIISDAYDNHISMSKDGKTVYFTSERDGGYGGLDMYKCEKNASGEWSDAVNLGEKFNTEGDEQSPFISRDGKTLYFASNERKGFGGYDIYKSVFNGSEWSEPENMGKPINSCGDDLFFYPSEDASEGFLSSNRKGSIGNYDIYRFYYVDVPQFTGKNTDISSNTIEPKEMISSLRNKIAKGNISNMFFRYNDSLVLKDTASLFDKIISNSSKNKIDVELVYNCDTCFYRKTESFTRFVMEKEVGIVSNNNNNINNAVSGNNNNNVITNSNSAGLNLKKIYFDFDKSKINPAYEKELEELAIYLKNNPGQGINIAAYTDSRGSEEYNKKLSMERAKQVYNYLLKNNVSKAQLVSLKGEGEENPAENCGKESPCTKEQHARNRRVEFNIAPLK